VQYTNADRGFRARVCILKIHLTVSLICIVPINHVRALARDSMARTTFVQPVSCRGPRKTRTQQRCRLSNLSARSIRSTYTRRTATGSAGTRNTADCETSCRARKRLDGMSYAPLCRTTGSNVCPTNDYESSAVFLRAFDSFRICLLFWRSSGRHTQPTRRVTQGLAVNVSKRKQFGRPAACPRSVFTCVPTAPS